MISREEAVDAVKVIVEYCNERLCRDCMFGNGSHGRRCVGSEARDFLEEWEEDE